MSLRSLNLFQMNKKDKELIKKSIESHGGTYTGVLDMENTEILIISKPEGDKYKYARKWRIPCLTTDFVFDSIEKGYCLPADDYRVDAGNRFSNKLILLHALWFLRVTNTKPVLEHKGFFSIFEYSSPLFFRKSSTCS